MARDCAGACLGCLLSLRVRAPKAPPGLSVMSSTTAKLPVPGSLRFLLDPLSKALGHSFVQAPWHGLLTHPSTLSDRRVSLINDSVRSMRLVLATHIVHVQVSLILRTTTTTRISVLY